MPDKGSQSSDLNELSLLLQVQRNDKDSSEVRTVLDSSLSLAEKIEKIRKIDERARRNDSSSVRLKKSLDRAERKGVPKEHGPEDFVTDSESEEIASQKKNAYREIRRNQVNIKAFISPKPYLSFFFSDYRKIKQFGLKSRLFETGMFGLKFKVNRDLAGHFSEALQKKLAKPLVKILQELLRDSWLVLEKKNYNMLVMLKKHCELILKTDFHRLDYKNRNIIDRLGDLERSFLVMHHTPEFPGEIIEGFDRILDKDPQKRDQMIEAVKLSKQILFRDLLHPSLYNFILGLNIIKTRSMSDLRDLITPVGPLVYTEDFDCSAEVKAEIDRYLNDLEKKLGPNLKELEELFRTRVFLPDDDKGNPDFTILHTFYDKTGETFQADFAKDQENMVRFSQTFARIYESAFYQVFTGNIEIQEVGKISLFASGMFSADLDRLRLKEDRLEKLLFTLPSFPWNRYISLKGTGKGATPAEAEALREIADVFSIILSISRKLATILRNRKTAFEEESADWKPLSTLILQSDEIPIPFENKLLLEPEVHEGKSVVALLQEACTIGFQAAAFSFDSEIHSLLKKEKTLKGDIQGILEIYRRIAAEHAYKALKKKYNI